MRNLALLGICTAFLFACGGDDDDTSMDGSAMDTSTMDGSSDATQSGMVTVRVLDLGTPKPDVDVIFHGADGVPLETIKTGTNGEATRTMDAGGMVTVVDPQVPSPIGGLDLYTYYGVEPNDLLVIGIPNAEPAAFSATLSVTLPAAFAGASDYVVSIGCTDTMGTPNATAMIAVDEDCLGSDSAVDVLVAARNGDQDIIAYSFEKDVAVTDGGTPSVTMDAFTMVDGDDEWGLSVVNLDPIEEGYQAFSLSFVDDIPFDEVSGSGAGSGSSSPAAGVGPTDFYESYTHLALSIDDDNNAFSVFAERSSTRQITYNRMSDGLPLLAGAIVGQSDPARPQLAWIANGDVSGTDAGSVIVNWQEGMETYSWIAIFPATMSSIQTPALPDAFSAYRPTAASSFEPLTLGFWDYSNISSYAEFRNQVGVEIDPTSVLLGAMPATDEFRVTAIECHVGFFAAPGALAGFGILGFLSLLSMRRRRRESP